MPTRADSWHPASDAELLRRAIDASYGPGWTQKIFARDTGTPTTTVSSDLSGRTPIAAERMNRYKECLGMPAHKHFEYERLYRLAEPVQRMFRSAESAERARAHHERGELRFALSFGLQAIELAEAHSDRDALQVALIRTANTARHLGQVTLAKRMLERCLRLDVQNREREVRILCGLCFLLVGLRELTMAESTILMASTLHRRHGLTEKSKYEIDGASALLAYARGDMEKADVGFSKVVAGLERQGRVDNVWLYQCALANTRSRQGKCKESDTLFRKLLGECREDCLRRTIILMEAAASAYCGGELGLAEEWLGEYARSARADVRPVDEFAHLYFRWQLARKSGGSSNSQRDLKQLWRVRRRVEEYTDIVSQFDKEVRE